MNRKLLCFLLATAVAIGFIGGELFGWQTAADRYDISAPPEGPYNWCYVGTVIDTTAEDGTDDFTITLQPPEGWSTPVRKLHITPDTVVASSVSPESLQPGDFVTICVKTYHQLPEVRCELFYAEFHERSQNSSPEQGLEYPSSYS